MKVIMQAHARDDARYGTEGEALRILRDHNGHISLWVKWSHGAASWVDLDDVLMEDAVGKDFGFDWRTTMQAETIIRGWSKDA